MRTRGVSKPLTRPGAPSLDSPTNNLSQLPKVLKPGTAKVYERCKKNAEDGLRTYLLVPDDHVQSARRRAKDEVPGRVAVESIESFVGQNVEEMAAFSQAELNAMFYQLLVIYNERVDAIEVDKSVMIEIPPNLVPKKKR